MENLISVKQAAEFLAVRTNTVYLWIKEKNLPARRTGRHIKFLLSELLEWTGKQQAEYQRAKEKKLRPQRGPKPRVII